MYLERFLAIFPRNKRITVFDDCHRQLFRGPIWWLNSRYLLSSLVVDVYLEGYMLFIVVAN